MKYVVTVSETLSKSYVVEAENEDEAFDIANSAVENGEIELTTDDYLCESTDISVDDLANEFDEETYEHIG